MITIVLKTLLTGLIVGLVPITVMAETTTQTITDSDGATQINDAQDANIQIGDTHIHGDVIIRYPGDRSEEGITQPVEDRSVPSTPSQRADDGTVSGGVIDTDRGWRP